MTKHDLVSVLARLAEIAPEINKSTDDATAAVRSVEGSLRELNLGIDVWHIYETEAPSKGVESRHGLVYARVKGEFRIGVQTVRYTEFKNDHGSTETASLEEEVIPWDNCPRDVKVRAFPVLPDLLVSMLKKAERTLQDTKATAKAVSKVLAAAGAADSSPKKTKETASDESSPEAHEVTGSVSGSHEAPLKPVESRKRKK